MECETQLNPWLVSNVEEFLYFCCPECEEKEKSKELFLKHALHEHPNAKDFLMNNSNINPVKVEVFKDENVNQDESTVSDVQNEDCFLIKNEMIENEDEDEIMNLNQNYDESLKKLLNPLKNQISVFRASDSITEERKPSKYKVDHKLERNIKIDKKIKDKIFKASIPNNGQFENEKNCELCNMNFLTPDHFRRHIKAKHMFTVHEGQKSFSCNFCQKVFTAKRNLEHHIKHVHERADKVYNCEKCDKTFQWEVSLNKHIAAVHDIGKKQYQCEVCSKYFGWKESLAKHMATIHSTAHDGSKKHQCDKCGKYYR